MCSAIVRHLANILLLFVRVSDLNRIPYSLGLEIRNNAVSLREGSLHTKELSFEQSKKQNVHDEQQF